MQERWRCTLWIACHVMLITSTYAEGIAINRLLKPWDGFPLDDLYSLLRARFLVALPVATNLWILYADGTCV